MIRKLRMKFIAVNLAIVLFMLSVIFGLVYHFTKVSLENESVRMMKSIAATTAFPRSPTDIPDDIRLPFFLVRLGGQGKIVATGGGYFDLSDQQFLEDVVQEVLNSNSHTGTLPAYNLRFCRFEAPGSQVLVFADTTSEQATLRHLVETCFLIEILSLLAFLGISVCSSKWAVAPIEAAWKQQKQFVADASHELKTPLTVITTNAELLQQPDNSEEQEAAFSARILTTAQQMRALLEQMLDLARSDREQPEGMQKRLDLSELVADETLTYEAVLFEKGFPLHDQIEPGLTVCGTDAELRRLVGILLDNAGKYTSPGGRIMLQLRKTGKKRCLLSVADEGNPISPEDLEQLFKRFYRADASRSQTGSYGLGLAIAEQIVVRHRGKIWAESRGGFNTFFVELPIIS